MSILNMVPLSMILTVSSHHHSARVLKVRGRLWPRFSMQHLASARLHLLLNGVRGVLEESDAMAASGVCYHAVDGKNPA